METSKLTFQKLAWAAFLTWAPRDSPDGWMPDGWMTLYKDDKFRTSLIEHPEGVSLKDVRKKLIGFLNGWGRMRMENKDEQHASRILGAIKEAAPYIRETDGLAIESVDVKSASFSQNAREVFDILAKRGVGLGPTGAAKIMGVLNPKLFVMWDKAIADCYLNERPAAQRRDGEGYATFLCKMQTISGQVIEDFRQLYGSGQPEIYLSEQLRLEPQLPLAKYIDEFNHQTITWHVKLPPQWWPTN